jgi:hypothetical protein
LRTTGDTSGVLGAISFGNANLDKYMAQIRVTQDGATDSAQLQLQTQATGAGKLTRMTIKGDGKVGFGTTAPITLLHILSTTPYPADGTGAIRLAAADAGSDSKLEFYQSTTSKGAVGYDAGNDTIALVHEAYLNSAKGINIKSDGNVGIGTVAPASKLTVSGPSTEASVALNNAIVDITGTSTAHLLMGVAAVAPYGAWINTDSTGQPLVLMGAGGNVGIGIAAPNYKLQVVGTFRASDTGYFAKTSGTGLSVDHGTSFGTIAGDIHKFTGKVGIGTAAPYSSLHVRLSADPTSFPTAANTYLGLEGAGTSNGYVTIGFGYAGIATAYRPAAITYKNTQNGGNQAGELGFWTRNVTTGGTAPTQRMVITDDGNVGIGTVTPLDKLHIQGNILQLDGSPEYHFGTTSASHLNWRVACQEVVSGGFEIASGTASAGTGAPSDTYTNRFVIKGTTGQVQFNSYGSGTHTGTATYKLSVDSSGNIIETAIGAGAVDGSGTTNYVTKWTDGDTIGNSVVRDDGTNVGIGTTGNGYKLRVQGNVYVSGTLTEASSLAIKENIETYSPSLEKINKIRPVRYNKKKSNKKEVGLVAEELAEMFPELVETDEKGNAVGVNYSRAVAVLLHGFKELYKEVKEIKEKI